jgi:hypothetical protein
VACIQKANILGRFSAVLVVFVQNQNGGTNGTQG